MSKHEANKQKSKEMKEYAAKASKTFSKDTAKTVRKATEQVEQPYIPAFKVEV